VKASLCLYIGLLACSCVCLEAKELTGYRVGDRAEADVITPVPLDVVDASATTALQTAQAQQYPSIFRSYPGVTNEIIQEFSSTFAAARRRFCAELTNEFHSQTLDAATIESANFGSFVTAFGVENRGFPVTGDLAADWAGGRDGDEVFQKLAGTLLWVEGRRICPDAPPAGMVIGKMVRIVAVTNLEERLPLEAVQQGEIASAATLTTVSNAQTIFRREFMPEQQLLARAIAAFIKPNCIPDAPFTQLTRGTAVCQLVVSDHYDAGDTIVRSGSVVDSKVRAALVALDAKLKPSMAETSAPPVIAEAKGQITEPAVKRIAAATPQSGRVEIARTPPRLPHAGLIGALAAVSAAAFLVAGWQFWKGRKNSAGIVSTAQETLPFADPAKTDLAPQVTQAVREAVQQELAAQRRELLVAQQAATDEVASLVHRLDELQVPMQERLQTYEAKIRALEKELAARNEENRQLLKLKIEMVSRQLENERAATLVRPIAAQEASKN